MNHSEQGETSKPCLGGQIRVSERCEVVRHAYNVIHFKRCLDDDGQKALLEQSFALMQIGKNPKLQRRCDGEPRKRNAATPVLFYNWPSVVESLEYHKVYVPTGLLQLAEGLSSQVKEILIRSADGKVAGGAYELSSEFVPDAIYGIVYPPEGSFIPHVDGAKGWALAISVGEAANFFFCETPTSERHYVRVESGDAMMFKGGILYHGVESIESESAPPFWYRKSDNPVCAADTARFNLQFRDAAGDRLQYYPKFEAIVK